MNTRFRNLICASVLVSAVAVVYRPAARSAVQPSLIPVTDPTLPENDPVLKLFRPDRALNYQPGPVDPGVVSQLYASPLGKAYQLVHADRSIFMACGPGTKWCANPAFSFQTIFSEAALLAKQPDADVVVRQWAKASIDQDPLLAKLLTVSSLAEANQKLTLLAIANRMDLAYLEGDKWVGAEVHFIYGATPTNLSAPDFMVNLEFELPALPEVALTKDDLDFPTLAATWVSLPATDDASYGARLKAVLQQSGFSLDKPPTRIRTLKSRMNHTQAGPWRLSQLYLDPEQGSDFVPRTLDGQMKLGMPPAQQEAMWQSLTPPQTASGVAAYRVGASYQANTPLDYRMSPQAMETPPGVCNASPDTRNILALQQCSWCHTGETGTHFAHVQNRRPKETAKLSGFLVGKGLATIQPKLEDLYYGNPTVVFQVKLTYNTYSAPPQCTTLVNPQPLLDRRFHDVARRTLFLASFLSSKGPFRAAGGLAALNFATRFTE